MDDRVETTLRSHAPQVLTAIVRRYGRFDVAEDAVQEALVAAAAQWPADGMPDNPQGWLIRVASRRMIDALRQEEARRRREESVALSLPADRRSTAAAHDDELSTSTDDTLTLLLLCCHPDLSPPSQIALTLRAVGGLTTAEIARAFLVPETTMAQRISRAKATIKRSDTGFELPPEADRSDRVRAVLHVLYLVFNEGYSATAGASLQRRDLTREAIRLTRLVHERLPADGEVAGLLALMLLTEARSAARSRPDGDLIPLAEQDRSRWDPALITEGVALVTEAMSRSELGPYQLQAAIAAVHDEAPSASETDWPQILALYGVLQRLTDNPMVVLNAAVAAAMVHGPEVGLERLAPLDEDSRLAGHHRLLAVRAHLVELSGDHPRAVALYRAAAQKTTSVPERRYLQSKASQLEHS